MNIVALGAQSCVACPGRLVVCEWREDALLYHGGYGGTRVTGSLACTSCGYVAQSWVGTERPPQH